MEGWTKIGVRHYRHDATKVEVRNPLCQSWEIIGGKEDGYCYPTKWVAMQSAVGTKAYFVDLSTRKQITP